MTGAPRIRMLSRESRLLILTITVAVIVLLILARLRFPDAPSVAQASVQPLERLAARAPYEDLAADIARVQSAISSDITIVRIRSTGSADPVDAANVVFRDEHTGNRFVPALRMQPDLAIVAIGAGLGVGGGSGVDGTSRIADTIGPSGERGTTSLSASDPLRGLATIRVRASGSRRPPVQPLATLKTPTYVVAVEGTRAGMTVRPIFLGRVDPFESARWSQPILPLGSTPVSDGALLFSLDGGFIGMVIASDGAAAIVPAAAISEAVARLVAGSRVVPATLGVTLLPLTPGLARATRTATGVVVADVDRAGPSATVLQAGDVITRFGGAPTTTPDRLLIAVASRSPGETMPMIVVRAGVPHAAAVTLAPLTQNGPRNDAAFAGRAEPGVGTRVTHAGAASVFGRAGIEEGDIILRLGSMIAPRPAQISGVIEKAPPGSAILVVLRRADAQRVVAILIPPV